MNMESAYLGCGEPFDWGDGECPECGWDRDERAENGRHGLEKDGTVNPRVTVSPAVAGWGAWADPLMEDRVAVPAVAQSSPLSVHVEVNSLTSPSYADRSTVGVPEPSGPSGP